MSNTIQLTPYHSAVPSWSGFQYQGKVALCVVLDYILKTKQAELEDYFLELEWYEDFSIVKNTEYVSVHQVKSYKKRSLGEYKDALWALLGKSILNKDVKCYLHASTELTTEEKIKAYLLKNPPEVSNESNQTDSPKSKKGQKVRGYTPWQYYQMITENNAFDKAFSNFSLYSYDMSKRFCPLNRLEEEIKDKIRLYYNSLNGHDPSETQVETTYYFLLGEIDKHITKRHDDEQTHGIDFGANPDRIHFTDLIDVLNTEWDEPSEEFIINQLRSTFHSTCEVLFEELNNSIMEEGNIERLVDLVRTENYVNQIAKFSNDSFFKFCQMVTPHIEMDKATVHAFRELIPARGIDVFCLALYEIKIQLNGYKFIIKDQKQNNLSYLPSTLSLNVGRLRSELTEMSKIAVSILENAAIRNELYEIEVIITDNIRAESLESAANKIFDVENDVERNTKITKIKRIRLIDIETAMEELNERFAVI